MKSAWGETVRTLEVNTWLPTSRVSIAGDNYLFTHHLPLPISPLYSSFFSSLRRSAAHRHPSEKERIRRG